MTVLSLVLVSVLITVSLPAFLFLNRMNDIDFTQYAFQLLQSEVVVVPAAADEAQQAQQSKTRRKKRKVRVDCAAAISSSSLSISPL